MKDMERLKNALGIDSSIIGATVLYNEINKVQNALWKSLNSGRAMDDNDTDMMSNIIEIQDIWNLLYKSKSSTFDLIVTEKDLYIDRILLTRVKKL
jgi:predicted NACHT family NTPase